MKKGLGAPASSSRFPRVSLPWCALLVLYVLGVMYFFLGDRASKKTVEAPDCPTLRLDLAPRGYNNDKPTNHVNVSEIIHNNLNKFKTQQNSSASPFNDNAPPLHWLWTRFVGDRDITEKDYMLKVLSSTFFPFPLLTRRAGTLTTEQKDNTSSRDSLDER